MESFNKLVEPIVDRPEEWADFSDADKLRRKINEKAAGLRSFLRSMKRIDPEYDDEQIEDDIDYFKKVVIKKKIGLAKRIMGIAPIEEARDRLDEFVRDSDTFVSRFQNGIITRDLDDAVDTIKLASRMIKDTAQMRRDIIKNREELMKGAEGGRTSYVLETYDTGDMIPTGYTDIPQMLEDVNRDLLLTVDIDMRAALLEREVYKVKKAYEQKKGTLKSLVDVNEFIEYWDFIKRFRSSTDAFLDKMKMSPMTDATRSMVKETVESLPTERMTMPWALDEGLEEVTTAEFAPKGTGFRCCKTGKSFECHVVTGSETSRIPESIDKIVTTTETNVAIDNRSCIEFGFNDHKMCQFLKTPSKKYHSSLTCLDLDNFFADKISETIKQAKETTPEEGSVEKLESGFSRIAQQQATENGRA